MAYGQMRGEDGSREFSGRKFLIIWVGLVERWIYGHTIPVEFAERKSKHYEGSLDGRVRTCD